MSTQDEREDLEKFPMPLTAITIKPVKDYTTNCPALQVLDNILAIDTEMERIQTGIAPYLVNLTKQRDALLQRAIRENLQEGRLAVLNINPGRQNRNNIEDLIAFQLQFPAGYKVIRDRQKRELDEQHEIAVKSVEDSKIPLLLADDVVGKKAVTGFVGFQPVKLTYEVLPKKRSDQS